MVANPMAFPSALPKGLRPATIHSCNRANVVSAGTRNVSDRKANIHFAAIPTEVSLSSASQIPDDARDDQVPQASPELDLSPTIDSRLSTQERDSLRETLLANADFFALDRRPRRT